MKARGWLFLFAVLAIAVLAVFAFAQGKKSAGQRFTGVVTDSTCGEKHTMMPGSDAECTRECVKAGAKFALLARGGHLYFLQGKSAELDQLAAQKVIVTGRLDGNTIVVTSVAPAKR